ncbi:MAG: protein tyrosine phosphatase [Scandinavium sp.]|uniref:arsenate reductase/protein-tyrosine-phosphatase family protein n=1 Tax=Scandinavium sp. TaxID=2830653 RepID=UPI003F38960E
MPKAILIVCTANLCRSPIGERLLRRALAHKTVDSAGIDVRTARRADAAAIRIAQRHGLSLEGHQSRQFTASLGARYDLILVMEAEHFRHISRISPEARSKTMLLGHWLQTRDIPDPWHKSDEAFEHIYQLIDQACQGWVEKLSD